MGKQQRSEQPEYLGALIEGEQRLVLVPMDPKEPWAAFRRMRSWMQQEQAKAELDVFAPAAPLETEAKVIPLRKRISKI
ncbi:MAG: hypothetical protein LC750_10790 [Actinobacteria bacterium]|nr:hypothetical protein [Actinomycetota bacterium]